VLPSVGDNPLPPNFAFMGSCTLSEYFPSSFNMNCNIYSDISHAETLENSRYLQQSMQRNIKLEIRRSF